MENKISVAIMVTAVLMAGCAKEPPKCSDDETSSLVKKIILEQLGGSEGLTEKEIQENLKIELPRATGLDEKIKKYSCEAKLVAGGTYQLPITYESQLDDKNEHVVSVGGVSIADQYLLKGALIEGIKKGRSVQETAPAQSPQTSTGTAPSNIVGTWEGRLEGDGGMEIKLAPTGYDVAVNVSEASGCAGSIEGAGALSGNTMVLSKKEDDQVCAITIKFSGDTAELSEDNCSGYHGAACGFSGSLKKVK